MEDVKIATTRKIEVYDEFDSDMEIVLEHIWQILLCHSDEFNITERDIAAADRLDSMFLKNRLPN